MKNGLYAIRLDMLDGAPGSATGIMLVRDGTLRGGDSYFYYVGSYSFADGKWKGALENREHTPSHGARTVFGRRDVGIGFTGRYTEDGAEAEATALAGKQSLRFHAVLRLLVAL